MLRRPDHGGRAARPAAGGRRRRVVIDAGASRRGGGPQGGPRNRRGRRGRPDHEEEQPVAPPSDQVVKVPSGASVKDLSQLLGIATPEIIKALMGYGEMVTITQSLSDEAVTHPGRRVQAQGRDRARRRRRRRAAGRDRRDEPEDLKPRPPVITVMGHVDHGKTSLLDAIRETEVAAGEAGGITQHIGAYQVRHDGKPITFIDTPGHEAFTAMRARGAKVTDIAVIVVAADDGVMPQTVEAIDHAKAAEVPIVIVVNKIDKPDANVDQLKQQLTEYEHRARGMGRRHGLRRGQRQEAHRPRHLPRHAPAGRRDGRPEGQSRRAGQRLHHRVEGRRGARRGGHHARQPRHPPRRRRDRRRRGRRPRARLRDFRGETIGSGGPATPVEIIGFDELPNAGEFCRVVKNEKTARTLANKRSNRVRAEELAKQRALTLDDLFARIAEGEVQSLNLIIKADVQGSLEALEDALQQIQHAEVKVDVIHSGVGGITESDVMLAAASQAIIIGFNVRPNAPARTLAEGEGVDVRTYRVIYKVTEDVRAALVGMLKPEQVEQVLGQAEVRQVFKASKLGTIAGCMVTGGSRRARQQRARDPRRRGGPRRQDGLAQALPGRRARGPGRVRVRHPARGLQRSQRGRRVGGLRDKRSRPCRMRHTSACCWRSCVSRTAAR